MNNRVLLNLNSFEFGNLYGALIKHNELDKLTPKLQLKLKIIFTRAYIQHESLGGRAKKDLVEYYRQLKKLNKNARAKV